MHFTYYKLHWLYVAYILNEITLNKGKYYCLWSQRDGEDLQTSRIAGTKIDDAAFHRTVGFEP